MFRLLISPLFPLLLFAITARGEFPLRDLAVDRAILLSDWQFQAEPPNEETDWSTDEFSENRAAWPKVSVPGIWDKAPGKIPISSPEQAGWFRTTLSVPELAADQELALCFLGVKYIADVFVNGEYLGVHRGGYTPFLFSLPELSPEQSEIEVLVRVDNHLTNQTIPKKNTGWEIYGGIDREVYLLVRPATRPENVFVRTYPDKQGIWQLHVRADAKGERVTPLHVKLWDGEQIVSSYTSENLDIDLSLPVYEPGLWSPENPHLYQIELSWGKHQMRFPVGLRNLEWKDGKLHLNGEPIWLQGFGQHEFFPGSASILTTARRRKDLEMMKNLYGANALRTGHYPHHPDLFNLADEMGLLVFTEIPVWQNRGNSLLTSAVWDNWIDPQLNEMIIRHRNHPSIFGWGVLNEIGDAHAYIVRAREEILKLDPSRGVAAVIASHHDFGINTITDFAARNLHYGWYHSRSVYKLREGVDRNLENANGRGIWVAELGGMARPGRLGGGFNDDVRGTETYQDKMTRFGLQYILSRADELAGISLWTWSDYVRDASPHYHGILSATREPKLAAYTAMNLMAPPLVALGIEERASIPPGGTFHADIFSFSRTPRPGENVRIHWQIRNATSVKKEGELELKLNNDHAAKAGKVSWAISENSASPLHFLYVELQDEQGAFLHSQAVPFEAGQATQPGILRIPPSPDGKKHLLTFYGMTFTVYPHAGFMLPLPAGEFELTLEGKFRKFSIQANRFTDLQWEN